MAQQGDAVNYSERFDLAADEDAGYVFTLIPNSGETYKLTRINVIGGFGDVKTSVEPCDLNGNVTPSSLDNRFQINQVIQQGYVFGPNEGAKIRVTNTNSTNGRVSIVTAVFTQIK